MSDQPRTGQPLTLTLSPRLDVALQQPWPAWANVARVEGAARVASWIGQRVRDPEIRAALTAAASAFMNATDDDDSALALTEMAELVEGDDDLLADTLWEGVLAIGRDASDAEMIFEATAHLAAIAEDHGDPLAAAEYFIDFLNWRRRDDHASDLEAVETAFDEIIRLAEQDGEQRAAALFTFRQANFTRLAEADEERVTVGEWEPAPEPYGSWE